MSVQPVLSSSTAESSPGLGAGGGTLSPPDSSPVVVMPLSSAMLVIRSAVLLACLVIVPGLALVGVSWLDRFTTEATAENDTLGEAADGTTAGELDELQQLAGMAGVAKEHTPEQPLRIAPNTVPAFFGEQSPTQKPYWEQSDATTANSDVAAAVAQSQANPRITGVTMADEAAQPGNAGADPFAANQHLLGQSLAGQSPAVPPAGAQLIGNQQTTDNAAAPPRRPWATRASDIAQAMAQSHVSSQPQAQPQAMAQPYSVSQPQVSPPPRGPVQQPPVQQAAMQTEAVAYVTGGTTSGVDQQGALQAMIARLRGMGAAYFRLENWGQLSYFRCEMPLPENPRYHAYFEATNADPIVAVREVMEKVEKWQQQAAGPMIAAPPQQPGTPLHR